MTNALKKQICYASGTLLGWTFARLSGAKETIPYTIMGGLVGFSMGEQLIDTDEPKRAAQKVATLKGLPKAKHRSTPKKARK